MGGVMDDKVVAEIFKGLAFGFLAAVLLATTFGPVVAFTLFSLWALGTMVGWRAMGTGFAVFAGILMVLIAFFNWPYLVAALGQSEFWKPVMIFGVLVGLPCLAIHIGKARDDKASKAWFEANGITPPPIQQPPVWLR
jgi:hypothetical protein